MNVVEPARLVAPILVGREREFELLTSAVSSPPAVVTVEGDAGIGKTRLVTEVAASAERRDRRWLVGGCRRIHEPFPLGPMIEAVRGAAADLHGAALSPLAGALRPLLPELSDLLPPEPAALDDLAADRHRVFRALVEVIGSLGPVVLVLEDMHWADAQTIDFVSYLAAEPPADLALVLTFRPEGVDRSVRGAIAKLPAAVGRAQLRLAPLDPEQTGKLGAAVLGTARISSEFAEHLCARASGVPFAIEELLALLQARGQLVHDTAGWARRAISELDVPASIRDPVFERASGLSGPAQSVLEAAAVLDVPAPPAAVARVCGEDEAAALAALDEAVASGLLAERGRSIAFRHALAAEAVYEGIPSQRRARLHSRAASLLQEADAVPLGQLAHHLEHAGRVAEWIETAEAAAGAATTVGHDSEAVEVLEKLLRHAPLDPEQRWRIALKLARACTESGFPRPDIADLLARVLGEPMPATARAELQFWLALVLQHAAADRLRIRGLLLDAVDHLNDRPDLAARVMVNLGLSLPPGVAVSEHNLWLRRALDILPSIGERDLEVYLLGVIAMTMAIIGNAQWRTLTQQLLARTDGAPRSRRQAAAYLRVAMAACYIGEHQLAKSLVDAVARRTHADTHPRTDRELASIGVLLDFCQGRWEGLRERAEGVRGRLDLSQRNDVEVSAACLAVAEGAIDDARDRLAEAAQAAECWGESSLIAFVMAAGARQAVASGETEPAIRLAERFIVNLEEKEHWAPLTRALPAITQLLLVAGQESRARAIVARYDEALLELDAPLGPAALSHAHGVLKSAAGDATGAVRDFLAAADQFERLSCPYEAAQAHEHAAEALFETDPVTAERVLRAALDTYEALGASWDHARCTRVGRAHGLRMAATHHAGRKGYGDELSPREREVASLAARGLSNKAIAAQLHLSPHTIEKHIGRAMRKLGIGSRAAIGLQMSQGFSEDPVEPPER